MPWTGPPGSVPPDPTGGPVQDYLRTNAGRYTRPVLQARLEQAGYPPDAIAAGWAVVDAEDAARGIRDRRRPVARLIGGSYVGTWLVLTIAWVFAFPNQIALAAVLSLGLAVVAFVPGVVGYVIALNSRRLRRASATVGVAVAIVPLLILIGIAGTCVSMSLPIATSG